MIKRIIRVLRGGSWLFIPLFLRAPLRYGFATDYRSYLNGFRLVIAEREG